MKKNGLIIGLVVLIVIGAGIVWLIVSKMTTSADTSKPPSTNTSSTTPTDTSTQTVQSGDVAVTMQGEAFSPQTIKIKKGTKVTWTNNDSIQHNVVADASNSAGLPTDNQLFGKGGTYSFTFNTTGTFPYHCTVHPFMTGSVEVVD